MIVSIKNIEEETVKDSFMQVLNRYKQLHDKKISLIQQRVKSATMQARPVIGYNIFKEIDHYKVVLGEYVRNSKSLKVSDLPKDVLTGWFAHELGHIVDYQSFNSLQMIQYGIKYLTSHSFKKKVEHAADYIAIDHGFHDEIIAAKNFILNHHLLDEAYKDKIRKYYMSVDDVNMCVNEKIVLKPEVDF
ncbi:MAG: hypothetical protein R3345_06825 [Fulvivirga sp.]|nr:hypothetical protein [Fulvivirga sp.]